MQSTCPTHERNAFGNVTCVTLGFTTYALTTFVNACKSPALCTTAQANTHTRRSLNSLLSATFSMNPFFSFCFGLVRPRSCSLFASLLVGHSLDFLFFIFIFSFLISSMLAGFCIYFAYPFLYRVVLSCLGLVFDFVFPQKPDGRMRTRAPST